MDQTQVLQLRNVFSAIFPMSISDFTVAN